MGKKERKKVLNEIRTLIRAEENRKVNEKLEHIENVTDDSRKMFYAIKDLQKQQTTKKLLIDGNHGLTSNPQQQVKIITSYFKDQFTKGAEELKNIEPKHMVNEFTTKEVEAAMKKLKYGKSPGIDEMRAEHLKNGPQKELAETIKEIITEIAETGEYPEEIKLGILTPLQKPGKKQGPPSNLRPIILLSILRKILAIIMIKRITHRALENIPVTQAAYQAGRITTEHVFAIKILAELAITTQNNKIFLLMLDMSKAFDTVNRTKLF